MQCLVRVAAQLLNVVGIAVKDLQKRQGLLRIRKLTRHLIRRHQGHQRVVAFVIVAAKRPGIRERCGRDQPTEVFAGLDLVDDGRKQPVNRGVLHECDQRLDCPEGQPAGGVIRHGAGGQPQILGDDLAHAGEQHAPAHIREKLTTVIAIHGRSPLGLVETDAGGDKSPWTRLHTASIDSDSPYSYLTRAVLHELHGEFKTYLTRRDRVNKHQPGKPQQRARNDCHQNERAPQPLACSRRRRRPAAG